MASIKGVTLKNITKFRGHEGESCVQGNIYLDTLKVGTYSDSYTMGDADIVFTVKGAEELVTKASLTYSIDRSIDEVELKFFLDNQYIGSTFVVPKKGLNQLHVSIKKEYQGKGYGIQMLEKTVDKYGYVAAVEGRILNNRVYSMLDKLNKDKYSTVKTKYDEIVIYKANSSIPDIYKRDVITQ